MKIQEILKENQIQDMGGDYINDILTDMSEHDDFFEIRYAMGEADATDNGINKTDFFVPLGRLVEKVLANRGIELNDKSHWEIVENVFQEMVRDVRATGNQH